LSIAVALTCQLPSIVYAQQSDADYLKSLQGEARSVEVDQQTAQPASASTQNTTHLFSNASDDKRGGGLVDLTAGLSVEQFERVLKSNYIGSYLFYSRLQDKQKASVFKYYQANPDAALVRKKILQVSKQK